MRCPIFKRSAPLGKGSHNVEHKINRRLHIPAWNIVVEGYPLKMNRTHLAVTCVVFSLFLICVFQICKSSPVYRDGVALEQDIAATPANDDDYGFAERKANSTPYGLYGYGPNEDELGDLFEGDIAGMSAIKYDGDFIRNVIKDPKRRWPQGVVPYEINTKVFQGADVQTIKAAINEVQQRTCVVFNERKSEKDYIYITALSGCFSMIGRIGGKQDLSLENPGCMRTGTAIHEILHALGIWHEQSRFDRDEYITINWSNISPGMKSNFEKLAADEAQTFGLKYDYGSIMHYSAYSFAVNTRTPTIVPKKEGVTIGQRDHMSEVDSSKINSLYDCKNRTGVLRK